jgi:hypothetical protein
VARAFGREGTLKEPAPDPARLGSREHEELCQLTDAVPQDRARVADRITGRLVLGDPPQFAGRGEVIEQRAPDIERRWIARGRIRVAPGPATQIIDGRLEDLETDAGVILSAGSVANLAPERSGSGGPCHTRQHVPAGEPGG